MRIRLITKHSLHEEGGRCEPCPLPSMIQLEHFLLCSVHRCMQLSGRLRVGPGSQPVWGGGGGGGGRRHLRESERATLTSPAHRQSDGWTSALTVKPNYWHCSIIMLLYSCCCFLLLLLFFFRKVVLSWSGKIWIINKLSFFFLIFIPELFDYN